MLIRKLTAVLTAVGMIICSTPAQAYDPGQEEILFGSYPFVFAASKKEESPVRAPATTLVISQEEIKERGYRNLKDVLADLPGMETVDYYWSEIGTLVPVRGIVGNNKIVLLVNGTRVNPPGGENLMLRDDQSVRYAKRVEVVYGPGSSLYGADAVSLVINIVTIDEKDNVKNVNVSYGENNTFEASAGYSKKVGENLGVTAYGQGYTSNGTNYENKYADWFRGHLSAWETAGRREPDAYNRWSEGFNGFFSLNSNNTSLQSWVRWSDRNSGHGDSDNQAFSEVAHWRDFTYLVKAENKVEVTDNLMLTNTLSYNMYQIDPATRYVVPVTPTTNYNNWKYGRSISTELESLLNWTLTKWEVTLGASAADHEVVPKATFPGGFKSDDDLLKQDTPFIYYDTQGDAIADINRREIPRVVEGKYQRYGLFADTRWHATDKLDLVAGGRFDNDSRGAYKSVFNARGSAIYALSDHLTAKYIVGQAFVAPAMYFRYETYLSSGRLNHQAGDLKPEKALTNEINLVHHTDRWYNNLSMYYNTQSDLLHAAHDLKPENIERVVYVTAGVGTATNLTHNINLGKSKTYGVDFYSKYRFVGTKNSVFAGLSWVDAEYEKKDIKTGLDLISDKQVRLGGTYYVGSRFFVSPRFTWSSDPKLGTGQPATSFTSASTSLYQSEIMKDIYQLDLYASYKATSKMDVFTRFNNLTNNKYGKRGVGAGRSSPAELFQAELGFIFNF